MSEVRHQLLITLVHGTWPRGFFPRLFRFKQWIRGLIGWRQPGEPPPFWFEEGNPFLARLSAELGDIPHKITRLLWTGKNSIRARDETSHVLAERLSAEHAEHRRRPLNSSLPTVTEAILHSALCTFCTSLTPLGYATQTGRTRLL